eukprot:scaffold113980_cov24-Tisochrysis_lutea.AAC.9
MPALSSRAVQEMASSNSSPCGRPKAASSARRRSDSSLESCAERSAGAADATLTTTIHARPSAAGQTATAAPPSRRITRPQPTDPSSAGRTHSAPTAASEPWAVSERGSGCISPAPSSIAARVSSTPVAGGPPASNTAARSPFVTSTGERTVSTRCPRETLTTQTIPKALVPLGGESSIAAAAASRPGRS